MRTAYDNLFEITAESTSRDARMRAMKTLARELDWLPSYDISGSFGVQGVDNHLVVEHGLNNSAVLTFLKGSQRAANLDATQLRSLLQLSYNNLVEWHVFVSQGDILYVSNLTKPLLKRSYVVDRPSLGENLSSSNISRLVQGERFQRSVRACDDLLISVIERWRRLLTADIPGVDNVALSALFNAIIFVRGCEDWAPARVPAERRLVDVLFEMDTASVDLADVLADAIRRTGLPAGSLGTYVDSGRLAPFREFDRATATALLQDFYLPNEAAYDFNFALMSKHALSRIYERYMEVMGVTVEDSRQHSFINPLPSVTRNQAQAGTVFTPQFIASFFAQYVRTNTSPRAFRALRSIDPACGSGIFIRTLLEQQCDPFATDTTEAVIRECFGRADATDRNPSACEATRLSLALLHLVATGSLPDHLNVSSLDAIKEASPGQAGSGTHDLIITNPPYVSWARLNEEERALYQSYLGAWGAGRPDAYLAFIKLCLEMVRPSGFICLVLPQIFLQAKNASALRRRIAETCDVRCLIDLSSVPVFARVGAYPILLVLQSRPDLQLAPSEAQIATVNDGSVGVTLQACLEGNQINSPNYRTFTVGQKFFTRKEWTVLAPEDLELEERLTRFQPISRYLKVNQGLNTGADSVFIRPRALVPSGEESIYASFLPDKQILRYGLPRRTEEVVIYPFEGGLPLSEQQIRHRFPVTWKHLERSRDKLQGRTRAGGAAWWLPERARKPSELLGPKIIGPHLMLSPRFAVDIEGDFAVSRSLFIVPTEPQSNPELLWFYCGVLNSSYSNWFINNNTPRYGGAYSRLEVQHVSSMPVPAPAHCPKLTLEIATLVKRLSSGTSSVKKAEEMDSEIDRLVLEAFGFSSAEQSRLRADR